MYNKCTSMCDEVVSLPVEDRALIVEALLKSLNQPESEIDNQWSKIAAKRLEELRTGKVKAID